MKKRGVILSVLSLCVISIIIFNLAPKRIKFNSWGQGFVYLNNLKESRSIPPEALLITSINDWKSYTDKYLIMIGPGSQKSLLEDKALLIITLPSAMDYEEKTYGSYTVKDIKKSNNELIVYINLNKEPAISSSSEIKSLFYEPFFIDLDSFNKETRIRIIKE